MVALCPTTRSDRKGQQGRRGAQQRRQQFMRLAQIRDFGAAAEKRGGSKYQDRWVEENGDIERQQRVDKIETIRFALGTRASVNASCLYQRRVQVHVERQRTAQHLCQVTGDDVHLVQQPQIATNGRK